MVCLNVVLLKRGAFLLGHAHKRSEASSCVGCADDCADRVSRKEAKTQRGQRSGIVVARRVGLEREAWCCDSYGAWKLARTAGQEDRTTSARTAGRETRTTTGTTPRKRPTLRVWLIYRWDSRKSVRSRSRSRSICSAVAPSSLNMYSVIAKATSASPAKTWSAPNFSKFVLSFK